VLALRSHDQLLLTCGTNSYHPICLWRRPDSLSTIISNENFIPGNGKSPFNSQYPSVYDLIETGKHLKRNKHRISVIYSRRIIFRDK